MVSDKFQVRTTGPVNPVTRQPVKVSAAREEAEKRAGGGKRREKGDKKEVTRGRGRVRGVLD